MQHADQVQQVGGNHYGTNVFGHWDYCKATDVPYLEGNATKYIFRWRKKNGVQDLEKALSYIDKRLEGMNENFGFTNDQGKYTGLLQRLFEENKVEPIDRHFIYQVLNWETYTELVEIRHQFAGFILQQKMEAAQVEANSRYTNQG